MEKEIKMRSNSGRGGGGHCGKRQGEEECKKTERRGSAENLLRKTRKKKIIEGR